jgi:2-dehydro-3-deoxyphosphogluconate aldolase / (4S)-4-hydroxy-2-oxoglutarate aldolase
MKRHAKQFIAERLHDQGVLPMFSHEDWKKSVKILDALYAGGIRVVEFTNRSPNALNIFKKLKKHAADRLPDLILGAGTVMKRREAKSFLAEGANFIVAPVIDRRTANFCKHKGLLWSPGASTLNEMVLAHRLGADIVKVFPIAQLGGPAYLKAILAPCPWLRLMPTGGITPDEKGLAPWFTLGVKVVGIGSQLFTADLLESEQMEGLSARAEQMLRAVASIRKNLSNNLDYDKR